MNGGAKRMAMPYAKEKKDKILQMKAEGKPAREIAEAVGIELTKVRWFIANHVRSERIRSMNLSDLRYNSDRGQEKLYRQLEKIIDEQCKLLELYEAFLLISHDS
jgi:hypothetical protein